jgi:hypothetical protein
LASALKKFTDISLGEHIKPESPDRASLWIATNIFNELGIPAIKIGSRGGASVRATRRST